MAEVAALRTKLAGTVRESLQSQGKAYQSYGELLTRLGARRVKAPEFAREAADLYISAVSDAASSGVHIASDVIAAGARLLGAVTTSSTKAVRRAGTKVAREATAEASSSKPRKRRTRAKRPAPSSPQA